MTHTNDSSYEFGGFTLDANQRVLLYAHKRIDLSAKDFDVLLFMIRHPKRLIRYSDLVAGVWGDEANIDTRNITHHVAKVRKVLDCDPRFPTFIETVAKRGYRFIADVRELDIDEKRVAVAGAPAKEEFLITSHMFAPVFMGANTYSDINAVERESRWLSYKEFAINDGRLCLLSNGIGVWHLTKTMRFPSLSVIARWRRQVYDQILDGKHILSEYTRSLDGRTRSTNDNLFPSKIRESGYVFSALVMNEPRLTNIARIRNSLQLLACLTPLESGIKQKKADELALERRILDEGFPDPEMREFGLRSRDIGFACWNGVSYHQLVRNMPALVDDLVEFEIALQATWWFAKCLSEEMTATRKIARTRFSPSIKELGDMFSRIVSVGPLDTASQRSMIEALLTTSRLERLVNNTITQFERL